MKWRKEIPQVYYQCNEVDSSFRPNSLLLSVIVVSLDYQYIII